MRVLFNIFILLLTSLSSVSFAEDLGTAGAVYPIIERDALQEIHERARAVDWARYFNKKKMDSLVRNYKPADMKHLPRAHSDTSFEISMSYTLDFDIPDGKGGILYPKGYVFDPADYVTFPNILVFFDASDRAQVHWFMTSQYHKDYRVKVLLTGGSYSEMLDTLKRPVYFADRKIIDKFKIKAVPSVTWQEGQKFIVREYLVGQKTAIK